MRAVARSPRHRTQARRPAQRSSSGRHSVIFNETRPWIRRRSRQISRADGIQFGNLPFGRWKAQQVPAPAATGRTTRLIHGVRHAWRTNFNAFAERVHPHRQTVRASRQIREKCAKRHRRKGFPLFSTRRPERIHESTLSGWTRRDLATPVGPPCPSTRSAGPVDGRP